MLNAPGPALVRLYPSPLSEMPPTVKGLALLPLAVTVRLLAMVTAPLPRLRALLPPNVKLPLQYCTLFVARDTVAPTVLSIVVPAAIVSGPVPIAELVGPVP